MSDESHTEDAPRDESHTEDAPRAGYDMAELADFLPAPAVPAIAEDAPAVPAIAEDAPAVPAIAEDPAPHYPPPHDVISDLHHEVVRLHIAHQDIVDFLHRLFPGHGAPGTPRDTA